MTPSAASPSLPASRSAGLALPFGVVGLVGGGLVADAMFGWHGAAGGLASSQAQGDRIGLVVVGVVTAMCALLGRVFRQPITRSVLVNVFLLGAGVAIAGGLSGLISAFIAGTVLAFSPVPLWALAPAGGYLGLLFVPLYWPPLTLVFLARWGTGEPRAGSILARGEKQRAWVMTAFVVAMGAGAVAAMSLTQHVVRDASGAVAATAVLAALTVADIRRLGQMLSVVRGVERIAAPHDLPADSEIDLGIGDERWMSQARRDVPYRGAARTERSVRGAIFHVQGRLTRFVLVDAGLLVASLLLFLVMALHRAPAPAVVSVVPAPVPASSAPQRALPGAGVRWLSWYPLSPPILVDIDGDGREEIVGLRWNAGDEAHALSVTANDGATLAPIWQGAPIACQWANPQVRLVRSGDRLFLSDSEKLIHVYDLRTGHAIGEPLAMPENGHLMCADHEAGAAPTAWIWQYPKVPGKSDGFLLGERGMEPGGTEPRWCARPVGHPPCEKGTQGETCEAHHDYRAPPVAPKFSERYSLQEGESAVAIGFRRLAKPGDANPWLETPTLVGYDAKTHKVRWDQPVARELEAHAFPSVQVDLHDGKVFTFYQLKTGAWELSARDARSGEAVWSTEPPRAMEGTNFDSMTLTPQGLYLGLSDRLEVFDPATGASRGVVW